MKRYRKQFDFEINDSCFEPISSKPSETVPDLSLSIKEILNRFTRGIPLDDLERPVTFDGDNDFELTPENPTDLLDALQQAREKVAFLQNKLDEENAKKDSDTSEPTSSEDNIDTNTESTSPTDEVE